MEWTTPVVLGGRGKRGSMLLWKGRGPLLLRGGSWNFHTAAEASANRERDYTWRGNDHFGIRLVKDGQ